MHERNYFQPRPAFNDDATDYVLHFSNVPRPDLTQYPQISQLGDWMRYGDHDYRFWSHVSKIDLATTISQATGISPENFEIIAGDDFTDYAYF
ncbi:hypothetical protein [Loigolactobacillus zhaoyuanensis]|uniref:Uncharacterized protein n=1 Tax=Loigolactobacillus zhaoyuanensis TaxID=2486017 RepID=A0ABW8UIR8_9LACO|nr:hypothetical protein [Loigolactobacillus zhaoyuanensis]